MHPRTHEGFHRRKRCRQGQDDHRVLRTYDDEVWLDGEEPVTGAIQLRQRDRVLDPCNQWLLLGLRHVIVPPHVPHGKQHIVVRRYPSDRIIYRMRLHRRCAGCENLRVRVGLRDESRIQGGRWVAQKETPFGHDEAILLREPDLRIEDRISLTPVLVVQHRELVIGHGREQLLLQDQVRLGCLAIVRIQVRREHDFHGVVIDHPRGSGIFLIHILYLRGLQIFVS